MTTEPDRLEVSREEAISFCESALRNIGSLHLCTDDIDDIADALTTFRKKAIETNSRTGDTVGKIIEKMMMAMARKHDEIVSEREKGAALAIKCGNGMATEYWRAIAKAARRASRDTARG